MTGEQEKWLESEHSDKELSNRSAKGILMQFLRGGVVLLSAMILARLLGPSDFGVVATIMPLVALSQMLKNFGVTAAIIQSKKLTQDEVSTYFWLQILVGLILGSFLAVSGVLWADFYEDPRMRALAVAMGCILFIGVIGNVHNALLRRNLEFGKIVKVDVLSNIAALFIASIGAYLGLAYWALVLQQLVVVFLGGIGYWYCCSWKPNKVGFSRSATKGLQFGGSLTVGQVFGYLRTNVDILLIRKFEDETQLGYYGRAQRVMMMPVTQIMGPVMSVAFPLLSRQQEKPSYATYFENIFRFCMVAAVPAGVFGFFFPEAVVGVVLGSDWSDSVLLFKGLSIVSIFYPIANCLSVNLLVFRKVKIMLILPAISLSMSLVAFWAGIQHSVERLTIYSGIVSAVMVMIYSVVVVMVTPVNGKVLVKIALPILGCIAIGVFCVKLFGLTSFFHLGSTRQFVFQGLVFSSSYLLSILFLAGYHRDLRNLISYFKGADRNT